MSDTNLQPSSKAFPLPTPEMASALANALIDELTDTLPPEQMKALRESPYHWQFEHIVLKHAEIALGRIANDQTCELDEVRGARLLSAAVSLAKWLRFPAPYEAVVTTPDGTVLETKRRTITYFCDEEGFETKDWAAISALELGEQHVIEHDQARMTVTRVC